MLEREHRYSLTGNPPVTHHSRQSLRWFEHAETVSMLAGCGFRVDRFFLDFDPSRRVPDPDQTDFDGILTYQATRVA